jgi:plastocyanin
MLLFIKFISVMEIETPKKNSETVVSEKPSDTAEIQPKVIGEVIQPDVWFQPGDVDGAIQQFRKSGKKKKFIIAGGLLAIIVMLIGVGAFALYGNKDPRFQPITGGSAAETYFGGLSIPQSDEEQSSGSSSQQSSPSKPNVTKPPSSTSQSSTIAAGSGSTPSPSAATQTTPTYQTYFISYSNTCYSPNNRTIKVGDIITFLNKSTNKDMWPASDDHPSHAIYPEFDAKHKIDPGGSFSFKFTRKGSWKYHDHLKPNCGGIITVQ